MLPNAKLLDELYPLVEADCKAFKENAYKVAFEKAEVNEHITARLRFALKNLDKEKMDKLVKPFILEH